MRSLVRNGRAEAKDVPVPVVDVCLDLDVGTHRVKRIHVRAMCKEVDIQVLTRGARRVPAAGGGANAGEAAAPAETPAPATAPAALKEFKDGLPARDESGMQIAWLEVVLRDHGVAPALVLDDAQKVLLGR